MVRAAGGVVTRVGRGGLEVVLVHRPRYDDWSLPKGKEIPGETARETARREIFEETGLDCVLGPELPSLSYIDQLGRDKTVRYFLARAIAGVDSSGDSALGDAAGEGPDVAPELEVDEVRWLPIATAAGQVTRPDDRDLLGHAAIVAGTTAFIILVRHAHAGERSAWKGDDHQRPLSATGRRQAAALVGVAVGGASQLWSSPFIRCRQTLEPLAAVLGLEIEDAEWLTEGADPKHAMRLLREARDGTIACSHGDVIGGVVDLVVHELEANGVRVADVGRCGKASTWVLVAHDSKITTAQYFRPPRT